MIIAIDFDGTCVTHAYPEVGLDIGAVPILKRLVSCGHQLILHTMRSNKRGISPVTNKMQDGGLQDAVEWFEKNNIPLYGVNENPTQKRWTDSPKSYAQLYIDDAALGCPIKVDKKISDSVFVDWAKVENLLVQSGTITETV